MLITLFKVEDMIASSACSSVSLLLVNDTKTGDGHIPNVELPEAFQ